MTTAAPQPVRPAPGAAPCRVLFVIRDLESGGAQRQLLELACGLDPAEFVVAIATFYPGGRLASRLASAPHVQHITVDKRGRWDVLGFARRLGAAARAFRPDVVHGYLDTGNLAALWLARHTGAACVWGLRAAKVDLSRYDWTVAALHRGAIWCSRGADLLISNAEEGLRYAKAVGFAPRASAVVPNGIDTVRFRPRPELRAAMRAQWQVADETVLVGCVAAYDPRKGYPVLLEALQHLSNRPWHLVAIGAPGPGGYPAWLRGETARLGLTDRVTWVGEMADVERAYAAFDVFVLPTLAEGFPNALAEALASEVPAVACDAGDVRPMLDGLGPVVPSGDAAALAAAIDATLALSPEVRQARITAGRARVEGQWSVPALVARSAVLLRQAAARGR